MIRIIGFLGVVLIFYYIFLTPQGSLITQQPQADATPVATPLNIEQNTQVSQLVHNEESFSTLSTKPKRSLSEEGINKRVKTLTDEITSKFNLSSDEVQDVSIKLSRAVSQKKRLLFRDERNEILKEVIGEKRFSEYQNIEHDIEVHEEEKELEDAVIVVAKRTSLTDEQAQKLKAALGIVGQDLAPQKIVIREKMKEAMSQHFDGASGKESLKESYDFIQQAEADLKTQRLDLIAERLKGVLPEDKIRAVLKELGEG